MEIDHNTLTRNIFIFIFQNLLLSSMIRWNFQFFSDHCSTVIPQCTVHVRFNGKDIDQACDMFDEIFSDAAKRGLTIKSRSNSKRKSRNGMMRIYM